MPNSASTPFEAVQRELGELGEKIGQVLASVHLTGVPENISERNGTARHEIVSSSPPPSPARLPAIHLMRGRSRTKLEPR